MSRLFIFVISAALLFFTGGVGAVGGGDQALPEPLSVTRSLNPEEQAVEAVLKAIYQSYDSRDLRPFLAKVHNPSQYTDIEVTTFNNGWDDYIQNHVAAEISIIESANHRVDLLHFDNMGQLGYALYRYSVVLEAGGESFSSEGLGSAVLIKRQGEWRLRHRHTSENPSNAKAKADKLHQMVHPLKELAEGEVVPTLSLSLEKDSMSGWNVFFSTNHFTLTGIGVGGEYKTGEGHAHLYLDGRKIARIYGNAYQLPELAPGRYHLRATLNSHDHNRLAINGKEIADELILEVPDTSQSR